MIALGMTLTSAIAAMSFAVVTVSLAMFTVSFVVVTVVTVSLRKRARRSDECRRECQDREDAMKRLHAHAVRNVHAVEVSAL